MFSIESSSYPLCSLEQTMRHIGIFFYYKPSSQKVTVAVYEKGDHFREVTTLTISEGL